jgi:hypothetical protein
MQNPHQEAQSPNPATSQSGTIETEKWLAWLFPKATSPIQKRLVHVVHVRAKSIMSTGGSAMHEAHQKAAEQHELAAKAHRTAAEHNEKGDYTAAIWHSERALEYSEQAYKLAKEAHTKSGQIVRL